MPPKISVLIPVYNVRKYLPKCLESLQQQTFSDFEIIAIDDGSTDNSLAILTRYAKTDKRMRVISQKNSGIANTRNYLLEQATGEYFLFVDSDDWISSTCLQELYEYATRTSADLVQGWYKVYDEKSGTCISCDNLYSLYKGHIPPRSEQERFYVARAYPNVWGRLVRLSLIKENKIFCLPNKIMEDTSFSVLCYLYAKKIVLVKRYLFFYRQGISTSIMSSSGNKKIFDQIAQGCFLAEQCLWRGFTDADLYDVILHLIIRNCKNIKETITENETKQLHYAVSTVEEYVDLCSWKRYWRYKLFAQLAQGSSPKRVSLLARLLR